MIPHHPEPDPWRRARRNTLIFVSVVMGIPLLLICAFLVWGLANPDAFTPPTYEELQRNAGGTGSDAAAPTPTTQQESPPAEATVEVTWCGRGHPDRSTATAFYILGTVRNESEYRSNYVIQLEVTGQGGDFLTDAEARTSVGPGRYVDLIPPGGFDTWETLIPSALADLAANCRVTCVSDGRGGFSGATGDEECE